MSDDILEFDYKLPFKKPTFKKFFSHNQLMDIAEKASVRAAWDFNTALGDTIKEKYESLYVKLIEVNKCLVAKGAKGYFWVVTSPEIASVFETACMGFNPISYQEYESMIVGGVEPQGIPCITYCGEVSRKWRLYKDTEFPVNKALVGCNDTPESCDHYAILTIQNFII